MSSGATNSIGSQQKSPEAKFSQSDRSKRAKVRSRTNHQSDRRLVALQTSRSPDRSTSINNGRTGSVLPSANASPDRLPGVCVANRDAVRSIARFCWPTMPCDRELTNGLAGYLACWASVKWLILPVVDHGDFGGMASSSTRPVELQSAGAGGHVHRE